MTGTSTEDLILEYTKDGVYCASKEYAREEIIKAANREKHSRWSWNRIQKAMRDKNASLGSPLDDIDMTSLIVEVRTEFAYDLFNEHGIRTYEYMPAEEEGKSVVPSPLDIAKMACLQNRIYFNKTSKEYLMYDETKGYYINEGTDKEHCHNIRSVLRHLYSITYSNKRGERNYQPSSSFLRECLSYIADTYKLDADSFGFKTDVIPVKNGVLDLKTRKLLPHSPKYGFLYTLNVVYNPDAKCPVIQGFLDDIVRRDIVTSSNVEQLLEYLGHVLTPNTKHEAMLIIVGLTGSGKSVLLEIIQEILTQQLYSTESMYHLENDPFSLATVRGKLLNVCAELKISRLNDTSNIKSLVSGDPVRANPKGVQPFTFKPTVSLLFSCNGLPDLSEEEYALFRRIMLIHFRGMIPQNEKDKSLKERTKTSEELSGFFNLLLDARERLEKRGEFEGRLDIDDMEALYNNVKNPLKIYEKVCLSDEEGTILSKDIVYGHYKNVYCRLAKKEPLSPDAFKTMFTKQFQHKYPAKKLPYSVDPKRPYGWANLRLKAASEIFDEI